MKPLYAVLFTCAMAYAQNTAPVPSVNTAALAGSVKPAPVAGGSKPFSVTGGNKPVLAPAGESGSYGGAEYGGIANNHFGGGAAPAVAVPAASHWLVPVLQLPLRRLCGISPQNDATPTACASLYYPYTLWTYNRKTGYCEPYYHGACNGIDTLFKTAEDCSYSCGQLIA